MRGHIRDEYLEWLMNLVCGRRFGKGISYRELLTRLYNTKFVYLIPRDCNRAEDGEELRRRYILVQGFEDYYDDVMDALDGPCSVLEMMAALAIRCEETIMDDPSIGDRTTQWFWGMINNMGLGGMSDNRFDERIVDEIVKRFLYREYEPNGRGGLFTIKRCDTDLRTVEIWYQMCWYLDSIT